MKLSTGVKRLDEALGGGLPPQSFTILYAPPFIGKETLARHFLLAGMRDGAPGICVTTGETATDARDLLTAVDAAHTGFAEKGLSLIVDAYSRSIGATEDIPHAEYVDGPMNLNGLSLGVASAQRRAYEQGAEHRLVLDSLSTLLASTNAQTTFRFLQVFIGKAKRAGATGLLLMDAGMHEESEVQMMKHVVDGVIELRVDGQKTELRAMGVGSAEPRPWVEYKATQTAFDVVGSLTAGRIR